MPWPGWKVRRSARLRAIGWLAGPAASPALFVATYLEGNDGLTPLDGAVEEQDLSAGWRFS